VNTCDKKKITATRNFGERNSSLGRMRKLKYDMMENRERGEEGFAEIRSSQQT